MAARLVTVLVVFAVCAASPTSADTIVVNWDGSGAHTLIQDGINAASEGDTVLVMPGTYTGTGNINLVFVGTDCVLKGSGGAQSVTIDCAAAGRAFYFYSWETSACVVEGLTIANGSQVYGGAMYFINSSPTIRDCVITGNTGSVLGGAVMISDNSEPSFTAVWFNNNNAEYGAAVAINNPLSPSFDACKFNNNTAVYAGGAVHTDSGAAPTFDECVFDSNTAGATGGAAQFELFSIPIMNRCTLYANSAPEGSGVWCDNYFTLTNSIIAFGLVGEAVYCDGAPPFSSCSDIYGNAGGDWVGCLDELIHIENNFSEDPLFCDAPGGDFTLDVPSPCTAANAPACGLVGAWDIGCDTPVQTESWGTIKTMYR